MSAAGWYFPVSTKSSNLATPASSWTSFVCFQHTAYFCFGAFSFSIYKSNKKPVYRLVIFPLILQPHYRLFCPSTVGTRASLWVFFYCFEVFMLVFAWFTFIASVGLLESLCCPRVLPSCLWCCIVEVEAQDLDWMKRKNLWILTRSGVHGEANADHHSTRWVVFKDWTVDLTKDPSNRDGINPVLPDSFIWQAGASW